MTRDREEADTFHLTQDVLALTLDVCRVGSTVAAQALQRLHLIDYRRGDITVVDAAGLKAVAVHFNFACGGAFAFAIARASARRIRCARKSAAITAAATFANQS